MSSDAAWRIDGSYPVDDNKVHWCELVASLAHAWTAVMRSTHFLTIASMVLDVSDQEYNYLFQFRGCACRSLVVVKCFRNIRWKSCRCLTIDLAPVVARHEVQSSQSWHSTLKYVASKTYPTTQHFRSSGGRSVVLSSLFFPRSWRRDIYAPKLDCSFVI